MTTPCTTNKPLDFGASDPSTFKVCTFLVNVLSYMYDQWKNAGFPKRDEFHWQPVNACPVTTDFKVTDYTFGPLIWSKFDYSMGQANEPFGSVVRAKAGGSLYLVFRGSKSLIDLAALGRSRSMFAWWLRRTATCRRWSPTDASGKISTIG